MSPLALALIMASAGLHATWNMLAKKEGASIAFYAILALVGLFWSSLVRPFTPLHFLSQPPAFHAWIAGMLASELLYAFGLRLSYGALDMSTAYPMMRAIPLLLLAGITSAFGLGRPLSPRAVFAMVVVVAGCLLVPLRRFSDFRLSRYLHRQFGYVLLVALGTTGYTLCDSQAQRVMLAAANAGGVELSKPLLSLTYYSFRAAVLAPALWVIVLCGPKLRAEAVGFFKRRDPLPLVAGCCSSLTYGLVLISMNFVSNVAYVQAFRQIGLVFGMAEGAFLLKEKIGTPKIVGVAMIIGGLALSVL